MRTALIITTAAATLAMSAPAAAAQYVFTYTGTAGSGITASGTLTTSSSSATQLITAITGTFNGSAITALLAPGSFYKTTGIFGLPGNDNLLTYPATQVFLGLPTYLDRSGVSFTTATQKINIFFGLGGYGTITQTGTDPVVSDVGGTFAVTPLAAAVPEPAAWAMMIVGVGAIGVALRRRRSKVTTRFAL